MHSLQKSMIQLLVHVGHSEVAITKSTGHREIGTVLKYSHLQGPEGQRQQQTIAHSISGYAPPPHAPVTAPHIDYAAPAAPLQAASLRKVKSPPTVVQARIDDRFDSRSVLYGLPSNGGKEVPFIGIFTVAAVKIYQRTTPFQAHTEGQRREQ